MKTAFAFLFLCSVAASSAQACTETAGGQASPSASNAIDLQSGGGGDINQRFRMFDASAGDSGAPDSTDYNKRTMGPHSPSNDEINAAERGSPDSVDSRF